MSQPYKSGRQQNLNLGITSVTENRTVLQTIGKVGIGTTNAQNHSLFVVGTTNITGDINVGGASTFVGVGTFNNNLYVRNQLYVGGVNVSGGASISEDITTRNFQATGISTFVGFTTFRDSINVARQTTLNNLNVTGIATIQNLNVQSGFDVYDTQAVFHNNVFIAGNLSIGGTSSVITAQDLQVFDKEITLGITTDAFGNDISNDITSNHGGISIASTVGSPLVDLTLAGFSTLPKTYKQLMWVAANSFGVGTTDAWMFNYAVGIGSTLVPNGVYLAAGAIQATKDTLTTPNLNAVNANVTGVSTLGIASASKLYVSGVSTFVGVGTFNGDLYVGRNLYIKDDLILDELTARNLNITGLTTVTVVSATSVNATGIITANSFRPSSGYYQSANGTNSFYVYDGTGNVAFQGTIGVGQINSGQGYQTINLSSDSKPTVTFVDNGIFNGVVTARQFVGGVNAGVATIATLNNTNANITNANITNINSTGITTLGIVTASQLYVSGVSTLSTLHAPKLTYNGSDFGGSGYLIKANGTGGWTWADVPGIFSVNNILNGFNVQEEGLIVGTAGSITTLDFRGVNITATADPQPNGIATIRLSETPTFLTLNVSGISTLAGITTVSGSTLFTKQLNVSGVSTFAGIGTFTNDLYVGGNLYIQNDLVFDEATLRNINITGLSTLGVATASQLYVSGVTTTGSLTVTGTSLFQGGVQANSVIFANGGVTGNLTGNVTSTGSNSFGQATVTGVVTARQFIGDIQAGVATITQGNIANANGATLNYTGLSTITDINASGIRASGIITARQFVGDINAGVATITQGNIVNANGSTLNYTGLSTIRDISASGITVGIATITQGNITNANGTNLNYIGISTLNSVTANQLNIIGVVTARQFVGDIQSGIATITQGNIASASGTNLNYTGLSTITDISASGIRASGIVTARQFVGDINAGVATITQGNISNVSGATLNYTGLSTITDINTSGIRVSGVVTARQFVGDINAGVGTITSLNSTSANLTNINSTGISTLNIISANQINLNNINVTGVVTARQFIGDIQAGVATITQGNISNVSGATLNYTGLSTITDINTSGIRVSGVVTARQFVGDINAGVATITQGNITNASGVTLNYTGLSTLGSVTANQLNVTGVVTARQFVGDINAGIGTIIQGNITNASGATLNYTGLSTIRDISSSGITVGIATITQGNITNANGATLNYTGLSTIRDISASGITVGIATITTINGTNAVFTGNVSIGGTLTYEDVTNVDSIGVITARSDVRVGGNLSVVGVTTLASAGGITTTGGDLYVGDDIFFKGNLYQNGQLFAAGIGIGSTSRNPGSGLIIPANRIGVGFTDINIVGTGISIAGYGSTVVIDFGNIAAASGGALSISTVFAPRVQDVSFVGGASTSIIGISTQTNRFVYDTQTGSVGIGTSASSIPSYKLDVMGDINSSTSVKIKGVDVLEEAVRLAIAFG